MRPNPGRTNRKDAEMTKAQLMKALRNGGTILRDPMGGGRMVGINPSLVNGNLYVKSQHIQDLKEKGLLKAVEGTMGQSLQYAKKPKAPKAPKAPTWEKVGEVGVDAGLMWLGDPCYVLHEEKKPKDIGKDWEDFCSQMGDEDAVQFNYDLGHAGLGVCVRTGYGDGVYPVEVKRKDGRVKEVRIRFF